MIQCPEPAPVDHDAPTPAKACEWSPTGVQCLAPPARRAYRTGGRDWSPEHGHRWHGVLDVCLGHVPEARMRGAVLFRLPPA